MKANVLEFFEYTVSRMPEHVAISEKDRQISFVKLSEAALALATRIYALVKMRNMPIAVYLPKTIESVTSFIAALYTGNFYVPFDIKTPPERLSVMLTNLKPCCVITNSLLQSALLDVGWPSEKILLFDNAFDRKLCNGDNENSKKFYGNIDTDPVYVIYTSGSTGIPRGVTIPHRGVVDYIEWANSIYHFNEKDLIGSQAPFYFDNSTLDIYVCLSKGATLHLIPEDLFSFPRKLIEHLDEYGVTSIFWVPSLMNTIANYDILSGFRLEKMSKVLFAGEVMPARTLNYWRKHLPNALFSNLYGPTEITVDCTYYIISRPIQDDEPVPIGYPCRNSDILILNEKNEIAPDGDIGELCVRGSSLALGYWNAPDKTSAAFVENPLRPEYPERIYRTGDLVQKNKLGEIIFLGRKDSQIKHLGYRIELGEIELAANSLEGIRTACVLYNQAKKEITLFYESIKEIPIRQLREKLASSLPRYMLPSVFKWLSVMPMNPNGKIDRPKLAQEHF